MLYMLGILRMAVSIRFQPFLRNLYVTYLLNYLNLNGKASFTMVWPTVVRKDKGARLRH